MRLRRTAFPTMRAAIANPRRGRPAPVFRANIAKKASAERRASRYTRSNSDFCRRRCAGLNGRAGDKQVAMEPAARSARSGSDSETLATFRAAPGENLTTGSRRHAGAKTVDALTMQVAGLISTLHCWLSLLSSDFFQGWATAKVASKQAHAGAERRAARVRSDSRSVKRKASAGRQTDRSFRLWITRGPSV
jgi:hypothetical protein